MSNRSFDVCRSDSTDLMGCCGNPVLCINSGPCITRHQYRQKAMNTDTPVAVTWPVVDVTGLPGESDPNGISAHTPGAKVDAGKIRPSLVLGGFARALLEVSKVGTKGADKYTDNGWMEVPNGIARYTEALTRHQLKEWTGEAIDPDFGLRHAAHLAWNALARLELMLRDDAKIT